jgi:hypothetical protein
MVAPARAGFGRWPFGSAFHLLLSSWFGWKTRLVRGGMCLHSGFHRRLRRHDPPVNSKREKPISAHGAAVRGSAQQAQHPGEISDPVLARNARQIHIAALFAMHVPDISHGSRPGIKARGAGSATPGAQLCSPYQVVLGTSSARPARTVAMADGTQQLFFSPGYPERIRE